MFKKLLFTLSLFALTPALNAQTTLAAGDILFTSYNGIPAAGTAPDTFSFVILTPITATTVIYFTERGYQGGVTWQGSGGTEGTISWTCGSALAIGQEVEIFGFTARVGGVANGTVALIAGGNATTGLSLSNAGDQIIAFQGGGGDPTSGAASFKSGISWALNCGTTTDAGWNGAGCVYGAQSSAIPPGLTGGTNAFLAGPAGGSPNNDHARFNCTGTPYSTVAALKAAILNKANWTFGGATGITTFNIPPGCNYYNASLPVSILSYSSSCDNDAEVIKWSSESETRFDHYELQYSPDLETFYSIVSIPGKNTTASLTHYEYSVAPELSEDLSYFRLKMVDIDGAIELSDPISSKQCNKYEDALLHSYSFQNQQFNIKLNESNTSVELFNTMGQALTGSIRLNDNLEITIPVSSDCPTVYFLKISSADQSTTIIHRLFSN
ncbi:MAG TPA: T9SS type A sorting domain-containing protein [Fluviicola sp.]|nr:T9SS type A sorting domain-containing protein [Fluviicola sp.]